MFSIAATKRNKTLFPKGAWAEKSIFNSPLDDNNEETDTVCFGLGSPPLSPTQSLLTSSQSSVTSLASLSLRESQPSLVGMGGGRGGGGGGAWGQVSGAEVLKRSLNVTPTLFNKLKSAPGLINPGSDPGPLRDRSLSDGRGGSHGNLSRAPTSFNRERRGQYGKQGSSEERGGGRGRGGQKLRVEQYNRSFSENTGVRGGRGGRKRQGGGSEPASGYSRNRSKNN